MKASPVVLLVVGFLSFMPSLHAAEEGISVTASGTVQVKPDTGMFDVVVQSTEKDAARAAARTAESVTLLQSSLRSAGIPVADSPSSGYSVRLVWAWEQSSGRNLLKGYVARHVVRVTVRDLRLAGAAVDAAVRSGAGEVGDVRFVSSRYDALRRAALELAVRNAREDAGVMARAAGGSLGALVELTSDEPQRSPRFQMEEATLMKAAPVAPQTEITPGDQEISVSVHSRWRFSPHTVK